MNHHITTTCGDQVFCSRCAKWLPTELRDIECVTRPLIDMTLPEALATKFDRGRKKHRGPATSWVGDPLIELFEEMLDAIHYSEHLTATGHDMSRMTKTFRAFATELQTIWRARPKAQR